MSRILAIDYGARRIGLAVSDPTRTIAQPLPTLRRRRGRRPPFTELLRLISDRGVEAVVIGLPLETSGAEGPQAEEVRRFGQGLADRAGVPVDYWDERLTSVRAQRELARFELPASARREKSRVDAVAAALILQAYLDAQREP